MTEAQPYRCPRCGQIASRVTHLPLPGGSTAMCLDGHEWDPYAATACPSPTWQALVGARAKLAQLHGRSGGQTSAGPASWVVDNSAELEMIDNALAGARLCPSCGAPEQPTDGECSRCGNHCFPVFPPDPPDAHWRPASDCNTPWRCREQGCAGFCHTAHLPR